jgi:hypothetical protein
MREFVRLQLRAAESFSRSPPHPPAPSLPGASPAKRILFMEVGTRHLPLFNCVDTLHDIIVE